MKEILFKKEETELLKDCLLEKIDELAVNDITNKNQATIKKLNSLYKKLENAEKKIKTSSAKAKGRSLQYWVCERIAQLFNVPFNQSDDSGLVQSRPMGQHGVDIILRGEVSDKFPYDIECKCCETLSIPEWVKQAKANEKDGKNWLVIFKKQSIGEPLVLMSWDTFIKTYKM